MAKNENERFVRIESQERGLKGDLEIGVDTKTGVNYRYRSKGNCGGLTVMVDASGNPIISSEYANRCTLPECTTN